MPIKLLENEFEKRFVEFENCEKSSSIICFSFVHWCWYKNYVIGIPIVIKRILSMYNNYFPLQKIIKLK